MGERTPVDDALLMAVERTKMKLRRAAKLARNADGRSSEQRQADVERILDTSAEDDTPWQQSG